MSTLYSPTVAQIPRNARDLVAFIRKLLTAAGSQKKLPASIGIARDQLVTRFNELVAVTDAQQAQPKSAESARPAALDESRAFTALYLLLQAWSSSTGSQSAPAQAALAAIYPNKLDFTHFTFDKQWAHTDALLRQIDRVVKGQSLAAQIEALAGTPLLDEIRAAHVSFGEALEITVSKNEGEVEAAAPVTIVTSLRATREAAQKYIVRVVAHAEESQPETVKLANVLLQSVPGAVGGPKPVKRKAKAKKSEPVTQPAPAPAPTLDAEKSAAPVSEAQSAKPAAAPVAPAAPIAAKAPAAAPAPNAKKRDGKSARSRRVEPKKAKPAAKPARATGKKRKKSA